MCKSIVRDCDFCGNKISQDSLSKAPATRRFCSRACYDSHRSEIISKRTFNCATCGKVIYGDSNNKMFCNHSCRALFVAKDAEKSCEICSIEFCAIKWHKKGAGYRYVKDKNKKLCSRVCLSVFMQINEERKLKTSHKLSEHPNWKGGGAGRDYRGARWNKIAEKCRDRYGRRCAHCGISESDHGRRLEVNHIVPFHQWRNKEKANAQSNLEALCKSCHTKADRKWAKENPVQMALGFSR